MLRLKRLFILSITFQGMFLAACGGAPTAPRSPDWGVGLDAIAPDGRWGTIVEHNGDPPACYLSLMKLGEKAELYPLNESTPCSSDKGRPQSSFSPDSNFVLYRISDGWGITEPNTPPSPPTKVATDKQNVQFLPNGRLLVISTTNDLTDFFDADPNSPSPTTSKQLLLSRVRYIFSIQRPLGTSEPSACADLSLSDRASWITIDADNKVAALVATRDQDSLEPRPLYSAGLTKLVTKTADLERAHLKAEAKAPAAGKQLSEEELEAELNSPLISALIASRVRSRLVGVPSPDGTKLLIRYSANELGEDRYTLALINLETGADSVELSTGSAWKPSFAFSPDGRQMLYESTFSLNGRSLYLANSDGSGRHPLITQDMLTPCWY